MIIVFGNQKGGCGKTTSCVQFANYLVEKGTDVIILDLDFQRSINDRRQEDVNTYDNEPLYEVLHTTTEKAAEILEDFSSVDGGNLLIDLPGHVNDDSLIPILKSADIIICPFKYDKLTMDSTGLFIKILEHLQIKAKLFFLPNKINKSIKYETKETILKILNTYGIVTKEIPERVAMERFNTLSISKECVDIVSSAYDFIIKEGGIK